MRSCIPGDTRDVLPALRQLNVDDVVITEVRGILLPEEIHRIRERADRKGLRASTTVGSTGAHEIDWRRTSHSAFIDKAQDEFVECIEERLATIAGLPASHLEPLQVTDYKHKQEYQAHYDFFDRPGNPERTTTIFAYLEDKDCRDQRCGGATAFYRLKTKSGDPLKVYPSKGDAIMWSNRTLDGKPNYATLHGGEKVTCASAHKVGLNAWFRDKEWE